MTSEIATNYVVLCQKSKQLSYFKQPNLLALFLTLMGLKMICIIRQLTSSSAADEVEVSTLLLATHLY